MKKIFIILTAVLLTATVFAQSPEKMSYQAVIRDGAGALVTNQGIGMKISILEGVTPVYEETQSVTTNANGLITLEIGAGSVVSGAIGAIDWSTGDYSIKMETDPTTAGGTIYTITGTSKLLSVPYALHAKTAENGITTAQANAITANTQAIIDTASQIRGDMSDVSNFVTTTDINALISRIEELEIETGIKVKDIDGNVYNTVTIGTQVWMSENLKTTHYANGTAIPLVNSSATWDALTATSKAYCWYNDDSTTNASKYGALYTWAAAMNGATSTANNPSGIQGVCPTGWHLPSHAEWTQMENYLANNGHNYDGTTGGGGAKIAKSLASTSGWNSSSTKGVVGNTDYPTYRNKSGFTALPGGGRFDSGAFYNIGSNGYWWSATEYNATYAWSRSMLFDISYVSSYNFYKKVGFSVRCLRD